MSYSGVKLLYLYSYLLKQSSKLLIILRQYVKLQGFVFVFCFVTPMSVNGVYDLYYGFVYSGVSRTTLGFSVAFCFVYSVISLIPVTFPLKSLVALCSSFSV